MLDALVATLVAALATRAADGVADAAHGAWSRLVRLVREKLGSEPLAAATLVAAELAPDDHERQTALAAALQRAVADDAGFGEQVRSLWQQAQVEIHAESGGVASQFSGVAQRLVQAGRDVTVYMSSPDRPPPIPHQVPSVAANFVNRVVELAALDAALAPQGSTGALVGVVVGMPGVGKTALARRWVAATRGRFHGGELHVDVAALRGRSGPGAVTEMLSSCLLALGMKREFLPTGLPELTNLLRTHTAEHPLLVVLDGVTEPGQVEALIPTGAGSAVLVTTEYELGELVQSGARMIPVKPLGDDEAISLLSTVCGAARINAEPNPATAVARLCGGLPVALQVAAARLVLDPTLTIAALADDLASEARRLDMLSVPGWAPTGVDSGVAAAFAVSYGHLPASAQRLYRDLGVMPVRDIARELVLAVADGGPALAQAALDTLVAASLVQRSGPGRYQLHQLVRLHAARQAAIDSDHDGDQVIRGVVDFYVARAGWADRAVMGDRLRVTGLYPAATGVVDPFLGPDRRLAGLSWLETEKANLLAVVRAAVDAELDEPACQLAEALHALYFNHRHHLDWIDATRLGVQAASRLGRADVRARLRSVVSRAFDDLGDFTSAGAEIDAAVGDVSEVDSPPLTASVWEFRGRHLEHRDRTQAIEAYKRSIDINIEAQQWRGAALGRYFLGRCLDEAGRGTQALAVLEQARTALRQLDDERMADRCTFSIGLAHLRLNSYADAKRELTAAASAFSAQQLWHYEVPAREALADLAGRTGDPATAREQLTLALAIEETTGGAGVTRLRASLARLN